MVSIELAALFFLIGVVIQSILKLKGKFNNDIRNKLVLLIVIIIIGILVALIENGFQIELSELFISISLLYAFLFSAIFIDEILPEISEKILLIFMIIFWYILIINQNHTLMIISLIPTIFILYISFTYKEPGNKTKVFLYLWFIFMCLYLLFYNLSIKDFLYSKGVEFLGNGDFLYSFFKGIVFFSLISYAFYLYYFIPLPGKHQSLSERMQDWREYRDLIVKKYGNNQLNKQISLIIIIIIGLFCSINFYYYIIEPDLLIYLIIVLSSFLTHDLVIKN